MLLRTDGRHRNTWRHHKPSKAAFRPDFSGPSNNCGVVLTQRRVFHRGLLACSHEAVTGRQDALIFASETEEKTRDKEQDYARRTTCSHNNEHYFIALGTVVQTN